MKILVTGDFCPIGGFDEQSFESVVPIFNSCDLRIVNFECAVASKKTRGILKEGPNLGCSSAVIENMKCLPIDLLTLANNHTFDYGEKGLQELINKAKDVGLSVVGAGMEKAEIQAPYICRFENNTIAVINCCESEFSYFDGVGTNAVSPVSIFNQIQKAKKKAEKILVVVHGGHEYYQLPSPRMQELYRFFIDAGACAVIGHHPHCFSGVERYRGGLIFYSLGNFFFKNESCKRSVWNEGYMVKLIVSDSKIEELGYEIIPYVQCLGNSSVSLLEGEEKDKFIKKLERLTEVIADEEQLKKIYESYVSQCRRKSLSRMLPYTNRILIALYKRGLFPACLSKASAIAKLNAIQCEAHRDLTVENLKKYIY